MMQVSPLRFRAKYYTSDGALFRRTVVEGQRASDMPQTVSLLSERDEDNNQTMARFRKVGRSEDSSGPYLRYEEI